MSSPASCLFAAKIPSVSITREVRRISEFAVDEIVLPYDGGPFEGQRFRIERQPFARHLFDEIERNRWSEYIITGPSQSGKTLLCFVVPIVWIVAELRKNAILALPDMNMADDKWRLDIMPVLSAAPTLKKLIPKTGPGSKGGKVHNTITLQNGCVIKVMTPFGDDSNKAGFTSPYVVVTEAARFSDPSQTSVEADPLRQLKARQRSVSRFDSNRQLTTARQMFVEGTVTLEDELPWKAKPGSTDSRIVCQCPHCRVYVTPEREHLVGWYEAKSELEAAETAWFCCPACGEQITDEQRREMNEDSKMIHAGQEIDSKGNITGDLPRSLRLFFRWNAFNNLFQSTADLAVEEWQAKQFDEDSGERMNAEKDLCQSIWCTPYVPPVLSQAQLTVAHVSKRREQLTWGMVPEDTELLTVGVDVGLYHCWYFGLAFRKDGRVHVPFYGSVETALIRSEKTPQLEQTAITAALATIRDQNAEGWLQEGAKDNIVPTLIFVDSNFHTDAVFRFCKRANQSERRWYPIVGRGESEVQARRFTQPTRTGAEVRKIGDGWYLSYERARSAWRLTLDVDNGKMAVQDMLRVDESQPGAMTLPITSTSREHRMVCKHLASEVRRTYVDPSKGEVTEWTKTGQNHLLDCAVYAYYAGRYAGWRPDKASDDKEAEAGKKPARKEADESGGGGWLSAQLA